MYRRLKGAYGVRSQVLHGTFVKHTKTTDLVNTSVNCDELLRKVLVRIAEHPENAHLFTKEDDEKFNGYFLQKVLGVLD